MRMRVPSLRFFSRNFTSITILVLFLILLIEFRSTVSDKPETAKSSGSPIRFVPFPGPTETPAEIEFVFYDLDNDEREVNTVYRMSQQLEIRKTVSRRLAVSQEFGISRVGVRNARCRDAELTEGLCQVDFIVRPNTSDIDSLICCFRENVFTFLQRNTPQPRVVLDAGANIGVCSGLFALLFPRARIVSVEADPMNFMMMQQNVLQFGERMVPLLGALWGVSGRWLDMSVGPGESNWGQHAVDPLASRSQWDGVRVARESLSLTLSDTARLASVTHFDFVKMDLEGGESSIFSNKGDISLLERARVLFLDYHFWEPEAERKMKDSFKAPEFFQRQYEQNQTRFLVFSRDALDEQSVKRWHLRDC